jgi:hypothetical protein
MLAAGAVSLFVLAGCGKSAPATPTKAQYVAKVNAICLEEKTKMKLLSIERAKLVGLKDAIALRERTTAKINAVPLPKKSERITPEWMRIRGAMLILAKRISPLPPDSRKLAVPFQQYRSLEVNAEGRAIRYGLFDCTGFASA